MLLAEARKAYPDEGPSKQARLTILNTLGAYYTRKRELDCYLL